MRESLAKITLENEESKISVQLLKNEVKTWSQKYAKIKIAHMNLLQMPYEKEKQIHAQDSNISKLNHSKLNCEVQSQSKVEEKEGKEKKQAVSSE